MNKQEIFDTVVRHLIKQGKPAIDEEGNCRYRTDDGLKCAAGCLIEDKDYRPEMEFCQFGTQGRFNDLPEDLLSLNNASLIGRLQRAHDDPHYHLEYGFLWQGLGGRLREIAVECDLDCEVLGEIPL